MPFCRIELLPGSAADYRCQDCGLTYRNVTLPLYTHCRATTEDLAAVRPPPPRGPGVELKTILESIGIYATPECPCGARMAQMNRWGVAGCREHFDEIVGWMRSGQGEWGWAAKLKAAALAVATGLAFKIDWLDPFPALVELAIERAEAKQNAEAANALRV